MKKNYADFYEAPLVRYAVSPSRGFLCNSFEDSTSEGFTEAGEGEDFKW